jgi:hypothetical protein
MVDSKSQFDISHLPTATLIPTDYLVSYLVNKGLAD